MYYNGMSHTLSLKFPKIVDNPTTGAVVGCLSAYNLLKHCPKSTEETLQIVTGSGIIVSLGINLYRHEEVSTFLHGFTTGLVCTMFISLPFLKHF
jgi:hypothetical protein